MARKSALAAAAALLLALLASPAHAQGGGGGGLGYIPPASNGCPQNVKVKVDASSQSGGWFSSPTVSGRATVLNGESYSVPVQDVTIMVFPANSPVAPVYADCWGIGQGQRVPYSPIPFQYGRASCTFQASLPTNGPSAGARNWQQARAVVTLTNGAKCYSDMTPISSSSWPWGGGGSGGGGGGSWIIGGANPSSGGGGGMGMGMGSSGPGMGMGSGMGSGRAIGGANPSSSSSGGVGGANPSSGDGGMMMVGGAKPPTTTTTMLGGANPSSGGGGRKMLGA